MAASPCSSPTGSWKLDKESALEFERTWLQVLQHKDTAALDCMLAADFKDVSRKGALRSKAQVLHELPLRSDQYQQKLTSLEADMLGKTAVVHGVNVISDHGGREVLRIRFTDILRFTNDRWLAIAAQETDEEPPVQSSAQPRVGPPAQQHY